MKKHNLTLYGLVILVFLSLIGAGVWQYTRINSGSKHPVSEKIFSQNKWVNAPQVRFKVLKVVTSTGADEKRAAVTMRIKQLAPGNYGAIKGNSNILNSIWINIPYGFSNMSQWMKNANGTRYTMKELNDGKSKIAKFYFTTPSFNYKYRTAPARLSILIPDNDKFEHYTKYSMFIDL
ncbi:hypothetical protein [Levilactobacillus parabrevis]|uniref:hypothetical protein n=1 Tax=Levilactobacillus parabrevis TaxID=357278 RepID=UPI0021A95EFC|nr:hypothetical protein [Levilactobacillus parabrevis]MCT4487832.1 hypothetical protein [Levilactobacillus parabrevis]MCT4491294.1 hypothetical protein [Levilactobacillus parabrevis]